VLLAQGKRADAPGRRSGWRVDNAAKVQAELLIQIAPGIRDLVTAAGTKRK